MPAAIEVRDVHKRFGGLHALSGIDLEIPQGEFFGLLGPNGAGKTTLINILAGLVRADRGTARSWGTMCSRSIALRAVRSGSCRSKLVFRSLLYGTRDAALPSPVISASTTTAPGSRR